MLVKKINNGETPSTYKELEAFVSEYRRLPKSAQEEVIQALTDNKTPAYVYAIGPAEQRDMFVKIGVSNFPERRLAEFQVAWPVRLALYGSVMGTEVLESTLHRLFNKQRMLGEWFEVSGKVKKFVSVIEAGDDVALYDFVTDVSSHEPLRQLGRTA